MGTKIYNKTVTALADGGTDTKTIQTNEDFELKEISFNNHENNSSDAVFFRMSLSDKDWSDGNFTPLKNLKNSENNAFKLPSSIVIPAKTTVTIEILNSSGASLTMYYSLIGVIK